MRIASPLPELAFVRVLTPGGPYLENDILSVAFVSPLVGRLAAHASPDAAAGASSGTAPLVPDCISAVVVRSTSTYCAGDELTLSFVDPSVARIHAGTTKAARPANAERTDLVSTVRFDAGKADFAADALPPHTASGSSSAVPAGAPAVDDVRSQRGEQSGDVAARESCVAGVSPNSETAADRSPARLSRTGVRVRLHWNPDRVRRFVRVVDKLFTVDRLGWYRHALAMRLLVPDEIATGDAVSDIEAMRHLHALRAAAVETLGRPLLAALMPNFSVSPEWLNELDSAAAARALAGLRDAIAPHVDDTRWPDVEELDPVWTVGTIEREDLLTPAASVEALLPTLIPSISPHVQFSERLVGYRHAVRELFGQTAQCADTVRLGAMSQPNHSLDDRLWQLVGIVGDTFGAVAGT